VSFLRCKGSPSSRQRYKAESKRRRDARIDKLQVEGADFEAVSLLGDCGGCKSSERIVASANPECIHRKTH